MTVGEETRWRAKVDFSSPLPAYSQVARSVRRRIRSGEWMPGQRIPTEATLCGEYDVSRTTIREALSELATAGMLLRRQGSGTFVADSEPQLFHDLSIPAQLRRQFMDQGRTLTSRFIPLPEIGALDEGPRTELGLESDAAVEHLSRLILIDARPVAVAQSWFPFDVVGDVASEGLIDHSLTETLRVRYGLSPITTSSVIAARAAPAYEAMHLGVYVESPLLTVTATSHLESGQAVEHSQISWNADMVRFTVPHTSSKR